MKKKIKISLILSLTIIFGCFSNVFAATNQNNKAKKIAELKKSVKLLDNQTQIQPIHRYTFDNDDDNTVVDTGTMAGKDGIYEGIANGTKIITENGVNFRKFNGSSDYIQFKDQIIPVGKKTIAFRIRTKSTKSNAMFIFANQKGTGTYGYGEDCDVTNGIIRWGLYKAIKNEPILNIYSNKAINDGEWHNVVMTWDGTTAVDAVKMYIDDLSTPNVQATATTSEKNNAPENLEIGNDYYGNYFNGDLTDFRVYDDVLVNSCKAITLNKTADILTLESTGNTDTLTAKVTPDNATNKTVNWASSDPTIVSVDANGKITALKAGTATITATTTDGSNLSKSCTVTVNEPTNITLDKTTDLINVGYTDKITASVTPAGQDVTWTSSDEGIAKVDQNGNITGLKAGTAIITATTADGKKASCTVTVKDQEPSKSKLTLYMNDKTIREFYLTQDEIDNFIDWYTSKIKGEVTIQPYYVFNVSVPGKSSTKKSYVWFMKIESFEVE